MITGKRARVIVLIVAAALLLLVIVWSLLLGSGEQGKHVAFLQGYHYTLDADDLYFEGLGAPDIRTALHDGSVDELIEVSKKAGLPSDVDKQGEITLMLLALKNQHVVTVYLVDGEPELGFVQVPSSGDVYPLGEFYDAQN